MAAAVAAANASHSLQLQPLLLNGLLVKGQSEQAEAGTAVPPSVASTVLQQSPPTVLTAKHSQQEPQQSQSSSSFIPVKLATLQPANEGFSLTWILLAVLLAVVIAFCAVAARRSADRDSIRIRRQSSAYAERRSISRTLSNIRGDVNAQSEASDSGMGGPGTPKAVARVSSYSERRRMSRMNSEPGSPNTSGPGSRSSASRKLQVPPRESGSAPNSESERGASGDEVGRRESYAERRRQRMSRGSAGDGSTGGHHSDGGRGGSGSGN